MRAMVTGAMLVMLLSGCFTPVQREARVAKEGESRLVCQTYKPTGSNRPVKTCRTIDQATQEERSAQEMLRRTQRQVTTNPTD